MRGQPSSIGDLPKVSDRRHHGGEYQRVQNTRDKDGEGHPLDKPGKERIFVIGRVEQPGRPKDADEYDGQHDEAKEDVPS